LTDKIKIHAVRNGELPVAMRLAIPRLCTEAFQKDFSHNFSSIPPDGLHILGYLDDRLVSHAVVTRRWLQLEKMPMLRTAYVDAVATAPAHQGGGFGSAMMRHLASIIVDDYKIACLVTARVSFYERLGWELWRGPLAGRSETGLVPTPDQKGIMILRLPRTPALNLEVLLTIECQPGRIW
jgi:aminoglycoside 2'-N-acetyltransferase I